MSAAPYGDELGSGGAPLDSWPTTLGS
jgi:hypothetical protein